MKHLAQLVYRLATGKEAPKVVQLTHEERLALLEFQQLLARSDGGLASALGEQVVAADWMAPLPAPRVQALP